MEDEEALDDGNSALFGQGDGQLGCSSRGQGERAEDVVAGPLS